MGPFFYSRCLPVSREDEAGSGSSSQSDSLKVKHEDFLPLGYLSPSVAYVVFPPVQPCFLCCRAVVVDSSFVSIPVRPDPPLLLTPLPLSCAFLPFPSLLLWIFRPCLHAIEGLPPVLQDVHGDGQRSLRSQSQSNIGLGNRDHSPLPRGRGAERGNTGLARDAFGRRGGINGLPAAGAHMVSERIRACMNFFPKERPRESSVNACLRKKQSIQ